MSEVAALVLFSGGQDSTVCLAWALDHYQRVETIGFDYGQRHAIELSQRSVIRTEIGKIGGWGQRLGDDTLLALPELGALSETALTRDAEITYAASGLPTTFVPGRNLVFLTYAAALAYRRGIDVLIGGMCETDYSGYPDCRQSTLDAAALALSRGLDRDIKIETPLMRLDKAATWQLAEALGGTPLVELIVEHSHTCYRGERGRRHDWGYGCGSCPACDLRAQGYRRWRGDTPHP